MYPVSRETSVNDSNPSLAIGDTSHPVLLSIVRGLLSLVYLRCPISSGDT